jgi:NTE family protein
VINLLQPWLTNITFDDLKIPFVATGVDLNTGQQVILNRGSLLEAILATIAVPGVFPPRVWKGHTLIDGGILDPVPVSLARFLAPNLPVVAVVLSPALSQWNSRATMPRLLNSMPLVNRFAQMRWAQSLSIFLRSIDMAGCLLTDLRLQIERPEVIIRPAVDPYGLVDKVDVPRIIRVGEEAVEAALPQIQRWVGSRLLQAPLPGNHPPRLPSA